MSSRKQSSAQKKAIHLCHVCNSALLELGTVAGIVGRKPCWSNPANPTGPRCIGASDTIARQLQSNEITKDSLPIG